MFADRIDAAKRLAAALAPHAAARPLVLAIPRGAVPMGAVLADALRGDLDVVLVRKLRAPSAPELAVGAIDETGWAYIAPHAAEVGADAGYLEAEKQLRLAELRQRRRLYTPSRAPLDPRGRTVIVVDDGLATGSTMMAALHSVRSRAPAHLVCAVPVASAESLRLVRPHADEVCCLAVPEWFGAVGQFYRAFPQVEDEEVVRLLAAAGGARLP